MIGIKIENDDEIGEFWKDEMQILDE